MPKEHFYQSTITWTGNNGTGTSHYTAYERSHSISIANKATVAASSDPAFRGDRTKHNPEELFLASISSCHMLWFLHLCSAEGIVVTKYKDQAFGTMEEAANGSGHFVSVTLHPVVTVTKAEMISRANLLHAAANKMCFIANSLNFDVNHEPIAIAESD